MTSVVHRPATLLPDVFGWLEAGWPFATNSMRVEQYVDDDKYVVRAELPGFDPEKEIQVSVDHGHLVVHAHRTQEEHGSGRSEFHYGAFSRTLPLPEGVSSDEISASYKHGILEVTMPAVAAAKAEPVQIKIGKDK
jgi:HSP20 family protein